MSRPFVSCICVTQNRRFFLRQAVRYFCRAAESYLTLGGRAELVIVDGSPIDHYKVFKGIPLNQLVSYYHVPSTEHSRTGWFHNEAVRLSKGDIIIQWDDDDWQDPLRIAKQVHALETAPLGAITYTSKFYWYHILEKKACLSRSWYGGGGSVGAMFAYHRKIWEKHPYRDVPQGEDNYFWQDHREAGTTFLDALDPSFCVYMRHNRNGSPLVNASYEPSHTVEARNLLEKAGDVDFYDELSELLPLDPWNRAPISVSPYTQSAQALHLAMRRR